MKAERKRPAWNRAFAPCLLGASRILPIIFACVLGVPSLGSGNPTCQELVDDVDQAEADRIDEQITKRIDEFAKEPIEPITLPKIDHENPPHEGAMIDWPYVVEPPDLILVEVLEALPGRAITGERLVRPDGTISLDFYGSVNVRGLTPLQIKQKIVVHLREFLIDEALGLTAVVMDDNDVPVLVPEDSVGEEGVPAGVNRGARALPDETLNRSALRQSRKVRAAIPVEPRDVRPQRKLNQGRRVVRSVRQQVGKLQTAAPTVAIRNGRPGIRATAEQPGSPRVRVRNVGNTDAPALQSVRLDNGQSLKITIDIQASEPSDVAPHVDEMDFEPQAEPYELRAIHPRDSGCVFVDVTGYNSKFYMVLGDVNAPGRLPFTGNETVLEALRYAGGLSPTSDRRDVRLVRPARGDQPAHVYQIDLDAIELRGDPKANLQMLPGDRLVVRRDKTVEEILAADQDAVVFKGIYSSLKNQSDATDMLAKLLGQKTLTPKQRARFIKGWNGIWWPDAWRGEPAGKDREKLRKMLLDAAEQLEEEAEEAPRK